MDMQKVGDLEINQDLEFERRSSVVHKLGWTVFVLIIIASLLGVFGGSGPLNSQSATQGALQVDYNRYVRHNGADQMKVTLAAEGATSDEMRVWLSREYADAIRIERIEPEPERVESAPDRLIYVFQLADPQTSTSVLFHLMPQRLASHSVRVGIDGVGEVNFSQFAYP